MQSELDRKELLIQKNRVSYTRILFAGTLAAVLLVVGYTGPVQAYSHKKLASIAASPCNESTTIKGVVSKDERHSLKQPCLEDKLLKQDLSGDSGPYFVSP